MNKAAGFALFALGTAIGSLATYFVTKKKYEQIVQEELDSMRETIARLIANEHGETNEDSNIETTEEMPVYEDSEEDEELPDVKEYASVLSKTGYTNYSNTETEKDLKKSSKGIKIISPKEFGALEDDGYETLTIYYYADQILADDDDTIIDDVESVVGRDSLNHFGEYEEDAVYVRNNERKCDYEILLSEQTYSEAMKDYPYKAGL